MCIRDRAIAALCSRDVLVKGEEGYLLRTDAALLDSYEPPKLHFVYALSLIHI